METQIAADEYVVAVRRQLVLLCLQLYFLRITDRLMNLRCRNCLLGSLQVVVEGTKLRVLVVAGQLFAQLLVLRQQQIRYRNMRHICVHFQTPLGQHV